MKRLPRFVVTLLVLLGLLLPGWTSSGADAQGTVPPVYQPGQSGYSWYLSDIDLSYQPYGIYIPTGYKPDIPAGLVFVLHGAHGAATRNFTSAERTFANTQNAVIVSLHGRGTHNYDGIGETDMFETLAAVRALYNIDEDRLFVIGCSMGGHGAYRWAFRYPGMFAAAAPSAGWTSYEDFYFKYYASLEEDIYTQSGDGANRPPHANLADYAGLADPSRRPLLETASALYQAENGKHQPLWIGYSTGDNVNYPQNALWVTDALSSFGYNNYTVYQTGGGHCAANNQAAAFQFFTGKQQVKYPADVVYRTNTLKYNQAYWVKIDRFQFANQWARIATQIDEPNVISVSTENITQYTLEPDGSLVDLSQPVTILTNGMLSFQGLLDGAVTLTAVLNESNRISGWSTVDGLPGGIRKTSALDGPISNVFQSRFTVVYGTSGTSEQTSRNQAYAEQFVKEWNYWALGLLSGTQNLGIPPQNYLKAIPDTAVDDALIAASSLYLFGDHTTNAITARIKEDLPLTLIDNGIAVHDRVYEGDDVRYSFAAPNPLNPQRYVIVSRGYLTEYLDSYAVESNPARWGKNLERLPFDQPDYVIWSDPYNDPAAFRASLAYTVQKPNGTRFRDTPTAYLEAGYFDQNWQIDTQPAVTSLEYDPLTRSVTLSASDQLGGFGVSEIHYRLMEGQWGDWQTYTGPIQLQGSRSYKIEFYSVDAAGRDISPAGVVPGNVEDPQTYMITLTQAHPLPASEQ